MDPGRWMRAVRVAAVAFRAEFGDVAANCASMLALITEAASNGAEWVCLPEVALQGYHTDATRMRQDAEPIDGLHVQQLRQAAAQLRIVLSVGMALLVDDGRRVLACIMHKSEADWMHARGQLASTRAWPAASGQLAGWRV